MHGKLTKKRVNIKAEYVGEKSFTSFVPEVHIGS